jgi:hypothetical protein
MGENMTMRESSITETAGGNVDTLMAEADEILRTEKASVVAKA